MSINQQSLQRISQLSVVALAALLTVMAVVALASRQKGHAEITALLARYSGSEEPTDQQDPKDNGEKKDKDSPDPRLDRITKRHAFSPEKKPDEFSVKLVGVLGNSAYFEGENKAIKVGDSFKGATLKKIGADWVEFDFKGQPKKIFVFSASKDTASPSSPPAAPGPAKPAVAPSPSPALPEPAGTDIKPTPEMIERFRRMSPRSRRGPGGRMPPGMRPRPE